MATEIRVSDLMKLNSPWLTFIQGDQSFKLTEALPPEKAHAQSLVFCSSQEQMDQALRAGGLVFILDAKAFTQKDFAKNLTIFTTPQISAAMATALPLLDDKRSRFPSHGPHPTAVIDPTAKIGKNVLIGAHVVIEANAVIGDNTILHPLVFVGARTQIGKNCEIHPHTTLGSDGFGFVADKNNVRHKIPQLGFVVLEDNVELGANCTIDRGTLHETRIGQGTKFDNLCHMAHNSRVGKNCVLAAGIKIAGSTSIGDNCMFGGDVSITDHIHITDNVIVGGRSAVTKDITKAGAYTGFPLEPMRDGVRTLANLANVTSMRQDLHKIKKHLGLGE